MYDDVVEESLKHFLIQLDNREHKGRQGIYLQIYNEARGESRYSVLFKSPTPSPSRLLTKMMDFLRFTVSGIMSWPSTLPHDANEAQDTHIISSALFIADYATPVKDGGCENDGKVWYRIG